jgi:hypothetical protein
MVVYKMQKILAISFTSRMGHPPCFYNNIHGFLTMSHLTAGSVEQRMMVIVSRNDFPDPRIWPCHFFLWGYIKDLVYLSPVLQNVEEGKHRIEGAATTTGSKDMQKVQKEFEYHVDLC